MPDFDQFMHINFIEDRFLTMVSARDVSAREKCCSGVASIIVYSAENGKGLL